jgi:iron complex outermembrane receptor protein
VNTLALSVFAKAENMTDTEARVHTSFIKDVAPRPGRNFSLGIRGSF